MAGVFISYRQADSKAWAAFLRDELIDVFDPEQIFLDRDTLRAGSWREQIGAAVAQCNVTLVVIGKGWLMAADGQNLRRLDDPNDVHRREIAQALARADMRVIPVLVDDAAMPDARQLPDDIRRLGECQARRFSDNAAHREVDVREISADIERAGGMRRRKATAAAPGTATGTGTAPAAQRVRYLPFVLDEAQARAAFAAWTRGLKLAPRDLPQAAAITSLAAHWVPLWLASATVSATWRGKKGSTVLATETVNGADGKPQSRSVSRIDYTELSGEFNQRFEDIVIDAGAALGKHLHTLLDNTSAPRVQTAASLPDDKTAVKVARIDQSGAERELRSTAEQRARSQVLFKMGGSQCEISQFDMRLGDVELKLVHCPVFEGRYRYANAEHTFWINADSAEVDGDSPLSKGKLALVAAAVGLVLLALAVYFVMR